MRFFFYSKIRCIALCVLQTFRRDSGFFCSVNHFSEAWLTDSRLLENSDGNRDGEWIFCQRKEADVAIFLQVTRIRKVIRICEANLTS